MRSYKKKTVENNKQKARFVRRKMTKCHICRVSRFFTEDEVARQTKKNRHKIHSNERGGVALATIMYFDFFLSHISAVLCLRLSHTARDVKQFKYLEKR